MENKIKLLLNAAYNYYRLNHSIMSDEEYDALFDEIREWELQNDIEDKLTDRVCLGYFEGDNTVKVFHPYLMGSIEKDNAKPIVEETVIMPKIDGVAVELIYKQGQLYQKLTRGNGEYGSDITKYKFKNIPNKLSANIDLVVRGEATCPTYTEYGKVHRNVVAGSLGRVDFIEDRNLYFTAYWSDLQFEYFDKELEYLKELGFSVVPYIVVNKPITIKKDTVKHGFPIDGYVLRCNKNDGLLLPGSKRIWAYKFASEEKVTTIQKVEWNLSKNGYVTPVAILLPVVLDGTTVTRVTLNNLDYIKEKNLTIGAKVKVHKAKDIIPEIVEVVEDGQIPIFITSCPKCGGELIYEDSRLKCENIECRADLFTEHFCKVMGVKGLALKSIQKLNIDHPLALYTLSEERYKNLLGKNGEKIYKQVQESKKADLLTVLTALNIPSIKKNRLKLIFAEYPELSVLGEKEKLVKIKGLGNKLADKLVTWYNQFEVLHLPQLEGLGFDLTVPEIKQTKISIVATGKFSMTRNQFKEFCSEHGIKLMTSVSKNTELVVIGDKPGQTKLNKAKELNIPVVHFSKFIKDVTAN